MAKKQQRPSPPKPICPYCGIRRATTRDHVIPRSLFDAMPVVGTITIRVCEPCNQEKSRDEDYFADMLQSYFLSEQNQVARRQAEGRMLRSAAEHSSDLSRAMV